MKPTKAQVEWLQRLSEGPMWYQHIPEGVRKVLRMNGWTTRGRVGVHLCLSITEAGRAVLKEATEREV